MKIGEIILYSNTIQKQKQFYFDVLEFELLLDLPDKISFKVGESILTFQFKEDTKPSHIAFNIPSNHIEEALHWLQKRIHVLDFEGAIISNFESWNAKAIYFYDADNNIIEFIARKDLGIESNHLFLPSEIISISEIAIVTDNMDSIYNTINYFRPIPIYAGNLSRFCALGNEEGLFILIDKNKKKWYPTNEDAYTSDFIIKGDYNFSFRYGRIKELL